MPLVSLADLPPKGALLGLDPGSKTIGVGGCDPGRIIAGAVETIVRGKKLAPSLDRLFQLYDQRQSVGIVMGLPINMDGTEGPRAQSARSLAQNILARRDIPLAFWDERLSTAGAERALLEALGGGCQVPLGAHARKDNLLHIQAVVVSPDGTKIVKQKTTGDPRQPEKLGARLAQMLLDHGAKEILSQVYEK